MSTPLYPQILGRRYPDLQWKMRANDLTTLVVINGTAPTQGELDALWPSVESEINQEIDKEGKDQFFQRTFSVQNQVIECIRAVISGDTTVIETILSSWENL